jgi:hypothetical protein
MNEASTAEPDVALTQLRIREPMLGALFYGASLALQPATTAPPP